MLISQGGRGAASETRTGPAAPDITPGELAVVVALLRARAARPGGALAGLTDAGGQASPTWRPGARRRTR